jgi:hypothetical protein
MSIAEAASLLEQLRAQGTPRPAVDPELAGGLREWLEDSLAPLAGEMVPVGRPFHVDLRARGLVQSQESPAGTAERSLRAWALKSLVRSAFRQWVTTARFDDPFDDALAAQSACGDPDATVQFVSRLAPNRRLELSAEVRRHAQRIARTWPALFPSWHPRTSERITIPFCGRRILLSGIVDLAVGPQAGRHSAVCIVDVESGPRLADSDRSDLHFYALLETLRAGAPPSRAARYYSRTGDLDVEPVDEHVLIKALLETIEVVKATLVR